MNAFKNIIGASLICAVLVTGCASNVAIQKAQTPEDAINIAFSALKELDMNTFNACTDNKKGETYRLFCDLFKTKNQSYLPLAKAVVADLTWKITNIKETGNIAIATVTISNKDFSNALGNYIADMICYVEEQYSAGTDLKKLIPKMVKEAHNHPELLLPYLEACQQQYSEEIMIHLVCTETAWQIQLDDTLCDTLLGHAGFDNFSEDIDPIIEATGEFLNNNLKRWGIELEENTGLWMNQISDKVSQILH